LANNNLGALVLPRGWEEDDGFYYGPGRTLDHPPLGSSPGIIAIVNAIRDMGALSKLDFSNNGIRKGEPLQLISKVCNTKGIELDNHESESDDDCDY
jgi:hypothetical protein